MAARKIFRIEALNAAEAAAGATGLDEDRHRELLEEIRSLRRLI